MEKKMGLIGSLITLIGLSFGFFVGIMGSWVYSYGGSTIGFNVLGGRTPFIDMNSIMSKDNTMIIIGVAIIAGAVLCLFMNKTTTIIGGIIGLIGCAAFVYWILILTDDSLISALRTEGANLFYHSDSTRTFGFGIGFYLTAFGSLISLIGGSSSSN